MRVILLILAFILLLLSCNEQQGLKDLKSPAAIDSKDSVNAVLASDKSWEFSKLGELDSSFYYANKALSLTNENNLVKIKAYSLSDIGNYYKWKEEYDSAFKYLHQSLELRLEYLDTTDIISGYNNLGLAYNLRQDYDTAIFFFQKGIALAKASKLYRLESILSNGLGMAKLNKGHYYEAITYLQKSIEKAIEDSSFLILPKRYQNLAIAYFELGDFPEAEKYFIKARRGFERSNDNLGTIDVLINEGILLLEKQDFINSLLKLDLAEKLSVEKEFNDNLTRIYHAKGIAYQALGNYDEAEAEYSSAMLLATQHRKTKTVAAVQLQLAKLQFDAGNIDFALRTLKALKESTEEAVFSLFLIEYYALESQCYANQKKYQLAYKSRLDLKKVTDSLNLQLKAARDLIVANERVLKEKELLKKENDLQLSKIRRKESEEEKQHYAIVALFVCFLGVLIYFVMRNRNIRLREKASEESRKNKEELMEILAKVDHQMLERQVETVKETSSRIGQDLHDNFGSKLAAVQLSLDGIRGKMGNLQIEISSKLDEIDNELNGLCEDTRSIAHNLMDRNLKKRGLIGELRQFMGLIDGVRDMKVHFIASELTVDVEYSLQKDIVSIIRTLIENVLRHSEASEVTIQLREEDGSINISVEDDGIGFQLNKMKEGTGMGLQNVKQRVESNGGSVNIESGKGNGTSVMFHIPIDKDKS